MPGEGFEPPRPWIPIYNRALSTNSANLAGRMAGLEPSLFQVHNLALRPFGLILSTRWRFRGSVLPVWAGRSAAELIARVPSRTRTCALLIRSQVSFPLDHRDVAPAGGAGPPASRASGERSAAELSG